MIDETFTHLKNVIICYHICLPKHLLNWVGAEETCQTHIWEVPSMNLSQGHIS
jgi:hypothetical protein